jgi:signal peptidase I
LVLLGLSVFLYFNFTTVAVSGESMSPTFKDGERLLACRAYWLIGPVQRKDVVVLDDPQKDGGRIIKRVLALGGDTVDLKNVPMDWSIADGPYKVPKGYAYVIGDNYGASEDSRKFGPVPLTQIEAKVVHIGRENGPAFVSVVVAVVALFLLLWMAANRVVAS